LGGERLAKRKKPLVPEASEGLAQLKEYVSARIAGQQKAQKEAADLSPPGPMVEKLLATARAWLQRQRTKDTS